MEQVHIMHLSEEKKKDDRDIKKALLVETRGPSKQYHVDLDTHTKSLVI